MRKVLKTDYTLSLVTNVSSSQLPTESQSIVYVIDDDESQRNAISNLLHSVGMRVEVFSSCIEFLRFDRPDVASCLVLDVRLKGTSGLAFQDDDMFRLNPIPIVFATGHGEVWMCAKAMKAGAVDFLTKPLRDQDLLDAVMHGIERDFARRQSLARNADLQKCYDSLTPRERDVMSHVLRGSLNKQIAADLVLSEFTVKMHRGQVMRKMGSRSVADLVLKAGLLGLVRFRPD
jgi:FixJ family two-component response regulator